MQLKLIVPEHGRHNQRQLHLRDVPAHAGTGAVGERDERLLLPAQKSIVSIDPSREYELRQDTYFSVTFSHLSGRNSSASLPQISLEWCIT